MGLAGRKAKGSAVGSCIDVGTGAGGGRATEVNTKSVGARSLYCRVGCWPQAAWTPKTVVSQVSVAVATWPELQGTHRHLRQHHVETSPDPLWVVVSGPRPTPISGASDTLPVNRGVGVCGPVKSRRRNRLPNRGPPLLVSVVLLRPFTGRRSTADTMQPRQAQVRLGVCALLVSRKDECGVAKRP